MKRFLFSLSFICPLLLFAQKPHSYTFDFSKPSELLPSITPAENVGEQVVLNNEVFNSPDKSIFLSFSRITGSNGVFLTTAGENSYYLFVGRGSFMTVTGIGVKIDSLVFSKTSKVGSLTLQEPKGVGYIDPSNESWYGKNLPSDVSVSKLVYENVGFDPAIQAFTVFYSSPMDVLEPQYVSPTVDTLISSFQQMTFYFKEKVKLGSTPKAILRGPIEMPPCELDVKPVDEHTIVASLKNGADPITTVSDEYTVTLFENSVVTDDSDGFYNKQSTYHFSIVEPHDLFNVETVYPKEGEVTEIPNGIILEFPSRVKYSTNRLKLVNKRTGEEVRELTATRLTDDEYTPEAPYYKNNKDIYSFIKLVFADDFVAPVRASDKYSLKINTGFFGNIKYSPEEENYRDEGVLYNAEKIIEYNVNGVIYPSDSILQSATDLLAITGVGYPAVDSPARQKLEKLVEEGIGKDTVFKEAMAAFYAETVIERPKDGYYLLSAIGSDGQEVFISYENGKVSLTKNVDDAAHLLATVNANDSTLVLETPDHKFLTQMMPTGANVSDTKSKMNNLTFEHLVLKDENGNDIFTPQQLFGLWSINGIIGTNDDEQDIMAYTLVNLQTLSFATNRDKSLRYFSTTETNAFRLTEAEAPIEFSFTPDQGNVPYLLKVTLSFTNISNVQLKENAKCTLQGTNGMLYTSTSINRVSGSTSSFVIVFDDVLMGDYTLTLPKGTFVYTTDSGKNIEIKSITAHYVVTQNDAFIDFNKTYFSSIQYIGANTQTRKFDDELDNFIIMMDKPFKFTVTDKKVNVIRTVGDLEPVAEGHFEIIPNFVHPDFGHVGAIKYVIDNMLVETLETELYQYDIPAGTYGDENYGKYLQDPSAIQKSQCIVNSHMTTDAYIFNKEDLKTSIMEAKQFAKERADSVVLILRELAITPIDSHTPIDSRITLLMGVYEDALISLASSVQVAENALSDKSLSAQELFDIRRAIELIMKNMREAEWLITDRIYTEPNLKYMSDIAEALNSAMSQIAPVAITPTYWKDSSDLIFDLSGRRVKDTSKPGIYIVNGKKVLVK